MKKYFLIIALSFLICLPVLAHQPHLVENSAQIINVPDPEISKAYYSELKGQPQYYEINSSVDFALYVNILIPAVPQTTRDMLVEVFKDNEQGTKLYTLDGKGFAWQPFFEDFARDDYFKGPELKVPAKAGVYLIKVSSPDNTGRYSLAIGEAESFPLNEIIRSLIELPQIKSQIFNKPAISAFFNIFGLFVWVPLVLVIIIIVGVVWVVKRRGKK
jgi:hypothetical protein